MPGHIDVVKLKWRDAWDMGVEQTKNRRKEGGDAVKFETGNSYGRRFKPGQSGNPKGRPPRKAVVDALFDLIEEQGATRAISQLWLTRILEGDYQFFREYLERSDGKVPRA